MHLDRRTVPHEITGLAQEPTRLNAALQMDRKISILVGGWRIQSVAEGAMAAMKIAENSVRGKVLSATTPALNVAYLEFGAEAAPPVVLLHGWPYDVI
jgi:hypothetical protein